MRKMYIPAHAGRRALATAKPSFECGTSPLTRVEVLDILDREPCVRYIPAHAGRSGEMLTDKQNVLGTSPLTRVED